MRRRQFNWQWNGFLLGLACLAFCSAGCGPQPEWVTMPVELPQGNTPDATFEEMRKASIQRDWPKFFGCLTPEARREVFETALMDAGHLAYVARNEEEYLKGSPYRKPLGWMEKACALRVAELMDEYQVKSGNVKPAAIPHVSELVPKLYDLMLEHGGQLVNPGSTIINLRVEDDWAFAQVENFNDRYHMDGYGNMHFKKIDDKWLVDASPWWIPWGPPASKARRDN